MVNANLVAAKLADLEDRIGRVRHHCPAGADAFDRDALDLVSFNLLLAVQACADIASHVVADEGWPAAPELRAGFERLEEHGVVSRPTRIAMSRAVGLRNVVAHGYGSIDPRQLHAAATSGLADLEAFAQEVARWVGSRP